MKSLLFIFIALFSSTSTSFADALEAMSTDDLRNNITPAGSNTVITSTQTGEGLLDAVLAFVRDSIFNLLGLIAIAVFLYIGARLLMARGNAEELKKALTSFVYAAIGLITVAAAYAAVRFIAGISI